MPREYKVGYARPPKKHQFKKGQSGNPKGRPKKRQANDVDVTGVLGEPVSVQVGSKTLSMTPYEASIRKLAGRAMSDLNAALGFLRLCEDHHVIKNAPARQRGGVVLVPRSWDETEFLAMLRQHGPPPWPGDRPGLPDRVNPPKQKDVGDDG